MAALTTFGHIDEFNPDVEAFTAYRERVALFFQANEIPEDRQVSVLLSVVGTRNYSLLRDLLSPDLPSTKSVKQLLDTLGKHFTPEKIIIAERFKFYQKNQGREESVAQFVAELKRLAATCKFGANLDDSLRDRFVCGLRLTGAQKKLLAQQDLTFQKAVDIATTFEAVEMKSQDIAVPQIVPAEIKNVKETKPKGPRRPCYRCGRSGHTPDGCRFKELICHNCQKQGHIAAACRRPMERSKKKTKWVQEGPTDIEDESDEELGMYHVHRVGGSSPPILVEMEVQGSRFKMEVDTGAAVSIVPQQMMKQYFPSVPLQGTDIALQTYTSEKLPVLGKCSVHVRYQDQQRQMEVYIVDGSGPALLGRDWLQHFKLDWPKIMSVSRSSDYQLQKLFSRYSDVFADKAGVMKHHQAKLHLKESSSPKYFRARPVPFAIRDAVGQELDRLEKEGILERVKFSDWAAPIVAVPKRDGRIRICGDYKVTVNPHLDVDVYPLPRPQELFATLAGGQRFTKLDLTHAYQQMSLEESSRKLVTINTHQGLYRYTRLPFGIASAPAIFQRTMDTILQGLDKVACFIDDILVTGSSDEEHLAKLEAVLQRLSTHGIVVQKSKCVFMSESVEYLGHVINKEGLHATPEKLTAILHAPAPRNVQELRSFLGLLNYYNRFIPNLASIISPLNKLLRKESRWKWTKACDQAMKEAKHCLISSKALAHYDPNLPIRLATDASAYGVGAVLSHTFADGTEHPIAFASRTLSKAEQNYAQIEKEALSIIFGVRKFHQYLFGRRFVLVTDHKPLTSILHPSSSIPSLAAARMQRWAIYLSAYIYSIEYRNTSAHANADGLSRLPLPGTENFPKARDITSRFNLVQMASIPLTHIQLKTATQKDPLLAKALEFTRVGWPTSVPDDLTPFARRADQLTVEAGCLLLGSRVVVPGILREKILKELHDGHPGISRMKTLGRSYVWWPGFDQDVEKMAKSCSACAEVKTAPPLAPLHPWVWPERPWQRIHMDFAGPLFNKMYLLIVDAHSKWPEIWEMKSTSASAVVKVLQHLFTQYGLPEQVVSDNGPQFIASELAEFFKQQGVRHYRSAPYHPATNGLVERLVKTFKQAMKIGRHEGEQEQTALYKFLLSYRSTPHPTTGSSPAELLLGRKLRTKLDLLKPDRKEVVCQNQEKQKQNHDRRARERFFIAGQKVMARDYRVRHPRWTHGTITEVLGTRSFLVKLDDCTVVKRHADQLSEIVPSQTVPEPADEVDLEDTPPEIPEVEPPPEAPQEPPITEPPQEEPLPAPRRYPARIRRAPERPGFVSF